MVSNFRDHTPTDQLTFHSREDVSDLRLDAIAENWALPEPQLSLERYVTVVALDAILPVLKHARLTDSVFDVPWPDGVKVLECLPQRCQSVWKVQVVAFTP